MRRKLIRKAMHSLHWHQGKLNHTTSSPPLGSLTQVLPHKAKSVSLKSAKGLKTKKFSRTALGLCSIVTFPGRTYLITVVNPENNPPLLWLPQPLFLLLFLPWHLTSLRWLFVFIACLHPNGNKWKNAGLLAFVRRGVSLSPATLLNLDT